MCDTSPQCEEHISTNIYWELKFAIQWILISKLYDLLHILKQVIHLQ